MEIGKLNQRITFLEHYTKVDEIGNHEARWDETFSCWAYVLTKSSSEITETGVTKEVLSLSFVVRQCTFHQCVNPTTHCQTGITIDYEAYQLL